jgi:hypothetical protein
MSARLSTGPEAAGPASAAGVIPAISAAAARTGVDFAALYHTARLESGFDPAATARTSSATGLFQFIDSSWMNVLAKHGARHGLAPSSRAEALALRTDPAVASLMAAEHMADNAALMESRLGREAGPVDLYLAHFLGAGGATRFLQAMQAAPDQSAASLIPAAARANRAIFFDGGRARSLADVHALFSARLCAGTAPAEAGAIGSPNPTRQPALPGAAGAPLHTADAGLRAADAARLAYLLLADMGA